MSWRGQVSRALHEVRWCFCQADTASSAGVRCVAPESRARAARLAPALRRARRLSVRTLPRASRPRAPRPSEYLVKNYTSFKALNPKLPFLLRPAQGIEPYVLAEYGASPRRGRARAATRPLTRARVRASRPAPGHGHVEQRDLANLTPNEIDETVTRARSRAARAPAPSSDRRFCRSLSVSPRAARVLRSSRSSWRSRRSSPSRGTRARTCRRRSWRRTTSARTRRARCRRRSNRRRRAHQVAPPPR